MLIFPLRYKHSTCCRYCECTMAMISSSTRSHAPRQHLANASCRSPPPVSAGPNQGRTPASEPTDEPNPQSPRRRRRRPIESERRRARAGTTPPLEAGTPRGSPRSPQEAPRLPLGAPRGRRHPRARRFFSAWTATFPTRKFEPRTRTPRPVTHPRAPSSRHRPRLRHRPSPSSSSVSSGGSSGSSVSFFSSV